MHEGISFPVGKVDFLDLYPLNFKEFLRALGEDDIVNLIEQDFSKYAPNNIVPRIRQLWNNIPTQLAKENKKFIYVR